MKPLDLLESVGNIQNEFIMEAEQMENYEKKAAVGRRFRMTLLAAVIAISLMAVTAFAAIRYLGLMELTQGTPYEIPAQAGEYIETQSAGTTGDGWSCELAETLFDEYNFNVSVHVTCDENYILLPGEYSGEEDASVIGLEPGKTLEAYAKEQGKQLLFASMSISPEELDRLGIAVQTHFAESQSEREATLMVTGQKAPAVSVNESACLIAVWTADSDKPVQVTLPFAVNKEAEGEVQRYMAENPDAVPGITVNAFQVSTSALGTTVDFDDQITDETVFEKIKRRDIPGITYVGGGWVMGDDGEYHCTWSNVQGEFADECDMNFVNWDGELVGTIHFKRQ